VLSAGFARSLTDRARENKLDPVIGRDVEITRVIQISRAAPKNNPVLIGEAGVGNDGGCEGLAQRIGFRRCAREFTRKELIAQSSRSARLITFSISRAILIAHAMTGRREASASGSAINSFPRKLSGTSPEAMR